MLKLISLARKNLTRNRRRTVLTVLSMAVSLFLLGVLLSLYAAFYHRPTTDAQALRLVTRHRVSLTQSMPVYYRNRIADIDGVENVTVLNWFGGTYKDNRPENMFPRFAAEHDRVFDIYSEFEIAPEQLEAFKRDRQGMAIGSLVAERVGLELGDRITLKGDIYPFDPELTVRAVFEGPDDFNSFFHQDYLEEALPEERKGYAGTFTIRLRGADDGDRVGREIDAMFRNAPEPTKTETEAAFARSFVEQLGNIKVFLMSIAGAVVFTIMLVSANTAAMSVRERIGEVGVLKTLGFRPGALLTMILGEAAAVALAGGILGSTLAFGATHALADVMVGFFSGFAMPLWGVSVCLTASLVIGLGSALIPAALAVRTEITDALRHTG